jgi:hypothetical protein
MSRLDKIIVAVWLVCVIAIAGNIYSATNFPTTLDSWTDQTAADLITSAKWNKLQDAIGALEVKVGADSSAVTTTIDHKLTDEIAATANLRSTLGVSPMPDWVRTIAVNAHSSGVSKADLVRLNATTSSAAELNVLDGVTVTSAQINNAATRPRGALVYKANADDQNITNGALADLTFSSEVYDTDSIHSTVTNTERLTVPAGVTYIKLHGYIYLNRSSGSGIVYALPLYKNGALYKDINYVYTEGADYHGMMFNTDILSVTSADYFTIHPANYSGATVTIQGSDTDNVYRSSFEMEIIS